MFNLKKTAAVLGASLLMLQGVSSMLIKNDRAEAVTYRPAISELMSRPYPIYWGNQFHSNSIGSSTYSNVPKFMDVITINNATDLFCDSSNNVDMAKKFKNVIPNVKVLQYLNLMDAWDSTKTYQWMKSNSAVLYDDNGKVIHPYYNSKRYAGNPTKSNWQDYWASRAAKITSAGFDGVFSDNWWRSNAQKWNISSSRYTSIQNGWETIGKKAKSRMGSSKILLGNGPAYGLYQARDMAMIEMRNAPNSSAFNAYLSMSDGADKYGQGNLDVIQHRFDGSDYMHSYSSILGFSLPACLLTNNMFGFSNDNNVFSIIKKVGKIGRPKGPRYSASGVLQRDFTAGKVIFNNTSSTKTVTVPSGYKNVDGNSVTKVTLSPYRGIVLKTSGTVVGGGTTPPPSTSTSITAPSNLVVKSVAKGSTSGKYFVNLAWTDNSNNETGFQILQSINSTSNFKVVKTPAANTSSYGIDLGTSPTSGTYYYKAVAVNGTTTSDPSNTVSTNIGSSSGGSTTSPSTGGSIPATPTNLQLKSVTKDSSGNYIVSLTWRDNPTNETGFDVLMSAIERYNFKVVKKTGANATSASVSLGSSPTKGNYYFRVKSFNDAGYCDSSTNVVTATIQ